MKKRFTAVSAFAVAAMLFLCSCGQSASVKRMSAVTENDEKLNGTIVATIGEEKISLADFNFIYKLVYDNMSQYSSYYGDDWENMEVEEGKTMSDYMKENTVEQIKQMSAALVLAEKHNIKVNSDVSSAVTNSKNNIIEENYNGTDGYKTYLEDSKTTDKAFDRYLEICEIYNRLYKELTKVGGDAEIKNDDIKKEFLDEYQDKWRVQHILISTKEQTDSSGNVTAEARSDEEAKKIADEVIAKLNEGAEFADLIEEYNEDPGMSKSKYYVFGTGEMVPEFEEASKNLEIDKYTAEPVKTDYGYHIIKRYVIDETIDEFKDFKKEKQQAAAMELINEQLSKLDPVTFDDEAIDKELQAWSEERKAAAEAESKTESDADALEQEEEQDAEEADIQQKDEQ